MKKLINLLSVCLLLSLPASAQNNVRLSPDADTVCFGTNLTTWIAGQSFTPISYQWSNGSTASSIVITSSGTYTLSVTGYMGNGNNLTTITKQRTYHVLSKPEINVVNGPWVCKYDTVKLSGSPGYTNYQWSNGSQGINFSRAMNYSGGGLQLDTLTVWYTASIAGVCQSSSDPLVIRGIRKPNGVGIYFCGKTDMSPSDSVRTGLVLEYIYPVGYEMEFTQVSDPSVQITYIVPPNQNRKAPLNILIPGESYYVRSRPVINGVSYCWGTSCLIGTVSSSNRLSSEIPSIQKYEIYNMDGKLVKITENFDRQTMWDLPRGYYIVISISDQGYRGRTMIPNFN